MEVCIEKLNHQGRGIGHIDGKVVFVSDTLPGEKVDIEIIEDNAKYFIGRKLKLIETSKRRVKSKCPYYPLCGGCQIRNMSYDDTIEFKKEKLKDILKRYASLEVEPIVIKNKMRDFYRNKVEVKVENGVYGFYKANTHEIVEIDRCLNAEEAINTIMRSTNLLNIKNGSITIKVNYNGEVILVVTSEKETNIDIEGLRAKCKLVGIIYNEKLIFGADHFIEIVNEMFFKETYDSFFQVNRYINGELFKLVLENIKEGAHVIDMCSGVGTLSVVASKKASVVYSLEIVKNAVMDGILNAKMNKRDNIEFMLGDAYSNIGKIKDDKIDTIIIDPPRSGLNNEAIKTILDKKVEKVLYISCDPVTLSRDLKMLQENYTIQKVYLLDMFSYTYHLETMCILNLR